MNLINILRWVLGIPLSYIITGLFFYILSQILRFRIDQLEESTYLSFFVIICVLIGFIPVIAATYVVPSPKKYGAVAVIVIGEVVLGNRLLNIFIANVSSAYSDPLILSVTGGLTAGFVLGFLVSYKLFKHRGWNKANLVEELEEY
ncbi:hypothetical protein LJ707_13380 [Mucilaginibacter sp. UR6-1]|uniref:hypothetical protein n=1 Tax=Mucilaginibacter sp. UR6-1 TaxID=1435643 RepID=UPI001E501676|nr:hypothetical protein [Mucilaginibacter sp. UR6-1]MCC8409924.1 hypothetical protein [Mucilaginibacter sp. UR6-1]